MIGAIAGDIIGSVFERHNTKLMDFPLFSSWCRFTDDTVMTVAIADAVLSGEDYGTKLKEWYRLYPDRGYGSGFRRWAAHNRVATRHSMGNGSAMRVSPVGFAFNTLTKYENPLSTPWLAWPYLGGVAGMGVLLFTRRPAWKVVLLSVSALLVLAVAIPRIWMGTFTSEDAWLTVLVVDVWVILLAPQVEAIFGRQAQGIG